MSFALLAPAALAAGVLLAAPVLAHLVRRKPDTRVPFGAMLLLERLRMRVERRRRLHDLLLLALRVLGCALLVFALARPELRLPEARATIGSTGRVVVVLDTSLSMDRREGGESAHARAIADAAQMVRTLPEGTELAAFTAGLPAVELQPAWTTEHESVAARIETLTVRAGGTDLDGALTRTRALLDGKPGEVVIYTDGAGPGNVAAARHSLERLAVTGARVLPRPVGAAAPANLVVADARYGDGLEGGAVSVRVLNYGAAREVPATVRLPDGAEMTVFAEVPAATDDGPGEVEVAVTVPRQAQGGVASVRLDDPDLPLDDTRYFHLPRVGLSRVLVVDGDPGSTPTRSEVYFLERALAPSGGQGAALDVVAAAGASRLAEGTWRVAVVANLGDPAPVAATLVDFVRGGGALILSVGDNVSAEVWNSALGAILPAPLGRPRDLVTLDAEAGVPLASPALDDELFSPFGSEGRVGFGRVRARRVFTLEAYDDSPPGDTDGDTVRTVLRYANGAPALVERRIGNGRVLLWTSTADLGWGNFPLQSVYVPFWTRLVGWLGGELGGAGARLDGTVGEPVEVALVAGDSVEVRGPGGERVELERRPGGVRFLPEVAGAYAVARPDEAPTAWVAVNVPARESDVRPDLTIDEVQAGLDPDKVRRRVPVDAGLVVAAAAVLVAATALSRRALPGAEGVA